MSSLSALTLALTCGMDVGESAVGKSSVVLRFCQNDFQENKEPTIGEFA
jgi:hypothetical protein